MNYIVHRIHYINVGNSPTNKAIDIIENYKKDIKELTESNSHLGHFIDYFVPIRDQNQSRIEIVETGK